MWIFEYNRKKFGKLLLNYKRIGVSPNFPIWLIINFCWWLSIMFNNELSSIGWNTHVNTGECILPKLNIYKKPIADKYFEGKLKNTLIREWNRVWKFMDCNANNFIFSYLWIRLFFKLLRIVRISCWVCWSNDII